MQSRAYIADNVHVGVSLTYTVDGYLHVWTPENERRYKEKHGNGFPETPGGGDPATKNGRE